MSGVIFEKASSEPELIMEREHMEKCYSSKNPLVSYLHNKRLDEIIKLVPKEKNLTILDAGCGEGHLLGRLTKIGYRNVYGADITAVALSDARRRVPIGIFSLQDITHLDYEDSFFDVVICTEVLEHIPKYRKVITELKRVLKKDGLLIITFPNEKFCIPFRLIFLRLPIIRDHVNWFTIRTIVNEVDLPIVTKRGIPAAFLPLVELVSFQKTVECSNA